MWYAFIMSKNTLKSKKYIWNVILTAVITVSVFAQPLTAGATTIGEIQKEIDKHQNEITKWTSTIAGLEDEQDLIEEQISDLNAEIINTMACIELKEEEIAEKEGQIGTKETQISLTEQQHEAAVQREADQRQNMTDYTRMMYENKGNSYLNTFFSGRGFSKMLTDMDLIEKVYEYALGKLNNYIGTKNEVQELWDRLELEKAGLQEDKAGLEADREELTLLKTDLDEKLAIKKRESANYDAEIKKAKQAASNAKKLLQADKKKLQQLEAQQNAANIKVTVNSNYASIVDGATGSEQGKKIAKYGLQYVGNPYVMGGTSLTKGADCSGFTYRIYSDFGYSIPRTSTQQRSAGTEVAYANAQPGDLICYSGHVGMYIGGGMIVHASNAKTGIKVSTATYRTILSVRRIIE